MIVNAGEKVHVIIRRRFGGDMRRHFIGEITKVAGAFMRVQGYLFIFDNLQDQFIKKQEDRESVFEIGESGYIVTVLPNDLDLEDLVIVVSKNNQRVLTDRQGFSMDINEIGANR